MKLLGEPSILRPDLLWSVLRALRVPGPQLTDREVLHLIRPTTPWTGGKSAQEKPPQVIHKALKLLDLVYPDRWEALEGTPTSKDDFCAWLHRKVMVEQKDPTIAQVYAQIVALCDKETFQDTDWLTTSAKMAAKVRDPLGVSFEESTEADPGDDGDEEQTVFNTTRSTAFRHWATTMGLGVRLPGIVFIPIPSNRLWTVLRGLGKGNEVMVADLLRIIAREMPYLDGSSTLEDARQRIGHRVDADRLSFALSAALRELHNSKKISLIARGDDAIQVELTDSTRDEHAGPRVLMRFSAVQIGREE